MLSNSTEFIYVTESINRALKEKKIKPFYQFSKSLGQAGKFPVIITKFCHQKQWKAVHCKWQLRENFEKSDPSGIVYAVKRRGPRTEVGEHQSLSQINLSELNLTANSLWTILI